MNAKIAPRNPSVGRLPSVFHAPIKLALGLAFAVGLFATQAAPPPPAGKPQTLTSPDQVPDGLAKSDWQSIRAAYEAGRHAFMPTATGWQARNPGQQWTTQFDKRGFLATPRDGAWTWGLELQSYGFPGAERTIDGVPAVKADGQRLTYQWDAAVQEWWVNDKRGLEHGFTVKERPAGSGQPATLNFLLGTRGSLTPAISDDAKGVLFRDAAGATVLNYTGLKVWDADGKVLTSRFELADAKRGAVRLLVDERDARYPLTIDPIAQQAYLKAHQINDGDWFGYSVSVSGDTVVVGAFYEDSSTTGIDSTPNESALQTGAAYVFVRSGSSWTQQAYLKASNSGAADNFGLSVAISGDTIVVGAPFEDSGTTGVNSTPNDSVADAGAAYVFVRSGTTWTQQAYLKSQQTSISDQFGWAVAISGDTIVVGAPFEDSSTTGVNSTPNESANDAGAAYVFVRSGSTWTQQAYLKAHQVNHGDNFGLSVSVSGDTLLIGATGEDSSTTGVNSTPNESLEFAGAAYVFVRSGTTWTQQAYLKASQVGFNDRFGNSVALSGDTAVVGAYLEDSSTTGVNSTPDENAPFAGAVYVFVRSGSTWTQQAYLKASNTGADDRFGNSVALSGDTLVVGAPLEDSSTTGVNSTPNDNASNAGAAYVFTRSGTTWTQQAYLKAQQVTQGDEFGVSVAVSGDTVVVGAFKEGSTTTGINSTANDNGSQSGASYIFTGLGPVVPPPIVNSISPTSGSTAGGTSVTITGTGFNGATGVTIGGVAATGVTVVNDTTITCVTPAGSAGTASVVVTTPGGVNAANTLFTYTAPTASPEIIIKGNNFEIVSGDTTPDANDDTDFDSITAIAGAGLVKRTFTIFNTGTGPLTLTGTPKVNITGATNFTVTVEPSGTITPNGSTTFQIAFASAEAGTFTASVAIANDDADESNYSFAISGVAVAGSLSPLPAQTSTFSGNVRGYWFVSPIDVLITGLRVPTDASSGNQSIAIMRLDSAPPNFSATMNSFTTLFLTQNNPDSGILPVSIRISAGDIIGVFGSRGGVNSYTRSAGSTILGVPVQFRRLGMQFPLATTAPRDIWTEVGENQNISRVEIYAGFGNPGEIEVSGNGAVIHNNDSTPSAEDHTDFGTAPTGGGTVERTFTITNPGTGSLLLTNTPARVELAGSATFTLTQDATTPIGTNGTSTFKVTFTPVANGQQTATVTIRNGDRNETNYTFSISGVGGTVSAPTVTAVNPPTGSTAGGTSVTITGTGFTGATGVTIGGVAATGVTVVNASTITCTTPAGTAGTASVVVTTPGGSNGANTLYTYTAPPAANTAPSVTFAQSTVTVLEDAGAQSTASFATFSPGPPSESAQTLVGYTVTVDNAALFSAAPAIDNNGRLTFTSAPNANGSATVTVVVQDSGGTGLAPAGLRPAGAVMGEGVDKSTNTFVINVTPVNDAPSFALPPATLTPAGVEWTARDNSRSWYSVASSADGTKLVASVEQGQLYTSTDSGATWSARDSKGNWRYAASSADGTKLLVAKFGGELFTSANSGVTWTPRLSSGFWWAVASSADGTKLVASVLSGQLYISADSGANWTARESNRSWWSLASSADGTKLLAADRGGRLYTSANSGVTWTARESDRNWWSVASSADGTKLIAAALFGQLYTSTDSGVTWTARESNRNWQSVASSTDGIKLVAADNGGQIYISTDSGVTWTAHETSRNWQSVASSADGSKLVAAVYGGQLYTSADTLRPFGIVVAADVGAVSSNNVATSISPGPAGESAQRVSFTVTTDNDTAFTVKPALNAAGTLTFTPKVFLSGNPPVTVTVTVVAKDDGGTADGGNDTSAPQTFTITITAPPNSSPTVVNPIGSILVNEDAAAVTRDLTVVFTDSETAANLTYAVVANTNSGLVTASITQGTNLTLAFTANSNGTSQISVRATDAGMLSVTNTFLVTVTPVNDAPVAVNDSYTVNQGDVLTIGGLAPATAAPMSSGVLANDTDIENDRVTATRLTDAAQGPVVLNANGGFTYTPNTNFYGTDTFTYRASDASSNSNPATVSILVLARPTNAVPGAQSVFSGATLRFSATNLPTANAVRVGDPDSTTLTVALTVTNGTVTVSNLTGVTFVEGRTNGTNVVLTGLTADVNAALESLAYVSKVNYFGDETLHVVTTDEGGRTNRGNGTVSILVEIPALGGIPKVSLENLNDPMTGRMITNVTMIASDTNLVKEITFNPSNNVVNVLAVGGQDGSTNRSTITVRVKFNDGTEQDVVVPVIIYQPLLTSVSGDATYNSTFGTPIFNPQTSLYEQKVSVVNNTPFDFTALRITATNLPAGVTLRNASLTNGGFAYIEYQLPVRSGSNVTLTLEYYNADRAGAVTPGLKLELLNSTRVIAPPANPVMSEVLGRRGYAPDGRIRFYLEFPTVVGQTYYVQYKDAVGDPWKTSPVIINGTGNRLNWLDDGAPNTDSPPSAGRFYRVITGQ